MPHQTARLLVSGLDAFFYLPFGHDGVNDADHCASVLITQHFQYNR